MIYYLDTSALVPLFFTESTSEILTEWVRTTKHTLVISNLAVAEFSSALSRNVRMGTLTPAGLVQLIAAFDVWRANACDFVEIKPEDILEATKMVQQPFPKLLTPDAIHLAATKRLGMAIVSLDADLTLNARARQLEIFVPA